MDKLLKIKRLRLEKNLTVKEISDKLGITDAAYYAYENGRRTPSVEQIRKIAEIFSVTIDDLTNNSTSSLIDINPLEGVSATFWKEKYLELKAEHEYLKQKFDQVLVKY